jgi:hypothetical protein
MGNKEIKKEIKKLENDLINVEAPALISNIESMRHREQDVFEVEAIEVVDERVSDIKEDKIDYRDIIYVK